MLQAVNKLKKEEKESKETLMRLEAEKDAMRQQLETAGADGTADEEERSTWQCERSALEMQVKSLKAQMEEAAGKAEALVVRHAQRFCRRAKFSRSDFQLVCIGLD